MLKKKEILAILPLILIGGMDTAAALTVTNPDPYTEKPTLTVEITNQGYKFSIGAGNNQIMNMLECGDYTFYDRVPVSYWFDEMRQSSSNREEINPIEIRWAGPVNAVDLAWNTQWFLADRTLTNSHYSVSYQNANPYDKDNYDIYYRVIDSDGDMVFKFGRTSTTQDAIIGSSATWRSLYGIGNTEMHESGIGTPTVSELTNNTYVSIQGITGDTSDRIKHITMSYPRILPETQAFQVPYFFGYEATTHIFQMNYLYQNMQRGDVAYIRSEIDGGVNTATLPSSETFPALSAAVTDMQIMTSHKGDMLSRGRSGDYESFQVDILVADSDLDRKVLVGNRAVASSGTNKGDLIGLIMRPVFPVTGQTVPDLEKNDMFIPAYYFSDKEYECKATAIYFKMLNDNMTSLESDPVTIKKSTNPWNCEKQDYTLKDSELVRVSNINFDVVKPAEYCTEGLFDEELPIIDYEINLTPVPIWRDHLSAQYNPQNPTTPTPTTNLILKQNTLGSFSAYTDSDNKGCVIKDSVTGHDISAPGLLHAGTRINYTNNMILAKDVNEYNGIEIRCNLVIQNGATIDSAVINIGMPPAISIFEEITDFINADPYGLGVNTNIFGMPLTAVFAVLISMVGYNRRHIPVSVILFITTFSILAYMKLVTLPEVLMGIMIVVAILAIFSKGFR